MFTIASILNIISRAFSSLLRHEYFSKLRLLLGLGVAFTAICFHVNFAQAACDPAPGQAAFFVDANFQGQCVVRNPGDYVNSAAIGLPNDSISSVKLGANTQVELCKDNNFGGNCMLLTSSNSFVHGGAVDNDQTSSLRVQPLGMGACLPGPGQASFYVNSEFLGACALRNLGDYANSGAIGLPNDSISSVRLGANTQVELCKDNNFGGDCVLLTSSTNFINGSPVGNDQTSSARVLPAGQNACMPAAGQVSFYLNANYLGLCVVKSIGDYPNSAAIGLPNDSISSVRVGSNAQTVVCKDNGFAGDCIRITQNIPQMTSDQVGNDEISSAKVQQLGFSDCLPGAGQASFFVHADFLGSCVVKGFGNYPGAENIGLPNDSISSVKVGSGAQLVLCKDSNYRGDCTVTTSNIANLRTNRIGNDEVTSAKIQPAGTQECQPGPNQMAFFMHANFLAPCVVKGIGDYANAAAIGLDDKSISSIITGTGVQACGCTGDNFTLDCQTFKTNSFGLGNFNDLISSIKVQALGATCSATPVVQTGYSKLSITNCATDNHTMHFWTRDLTAGSAFMEQGMQAAQTSGGGCAPGASPFTITLTDQHQIQLVVVDPQMSICGGLNDPQNGQCQRSIFTQPFFGDSKGPTLPLPTIF